MTRIMITGASSGIGRAVAEMCLAEGWEVGCLARRRDRLDDLSHPKAQLYAADVTDEAAVEAAFSDFCAAGPLDVLFNNAGIFGPSAMPDEIALDDFQAVLNTNVTGMFLCARAAFRQMRHQTPAGGRIINNGSISAHSPRAGGSLCYTVSKHAITGLTKTLALDGRDKNIACGQIDIGNARTDMVADLADRAAAAHPEAAPMATMDVAHAAQAVVDMAKLPLSANVPFMTIMATQMPYMGRG